MGQQRTDTSRGCVGCGPGVILIICLVVVIAAFAIALSGGGK